jgi:hypothetical protein
LSVDAFGDTGDPPIVLVPAAPIAAEIEAFASAGLTPLRIEAVDSPAGRRWLAEFVRPH